MTGCRVAATWSLQDLLSREVADLLATRPTTTATATTATATTTATTTTTATATVAATTAAATTTGSATAVGWWWGNSGCGPTLPPVAPELLAAWLGLCERQTSCAVPPHDFLVCVDGLKGRKGPRRGEASFEIYHKLNQSVPATLAFRFVEPSI